MKKLATLALLVPLAGCISFGPKPPATLLTLNPAQSLAVGAVQRAPGAATITIAVPTMPQELATLRIPVRSTPTTLAYMKDVRWVEPVNRMFARLLSDTISARTGRVVVGGFTTEVGSSLTGELRSFGVDAATGEAVVTFDGALIRASGAPFEKRRFEARVAAGVVEPAAVGSALNTAANQVAGEVADWVGR